MYIEFFLLAPRACSSLPMPMAQQLYTTPSAKHRFSSLGDIAWTALLDAAVLAFSLLVGQYCFERRSHDILVGWCCLGCSGFAWLRCFHITPLVMLCKFAVAFMNYLQSRADSECAAGNTHSTCFSTGNWCAACVWASAPCRAGILLLRLSRQRQKCTRLQVCLLAQ